MYISFLTRIFQDKGVIHRCHEKCIRYQAWLFLYQTDRDSHEELAIADSFNIIIWCCS